MMEEILCSIHNYTKFSGYSQSFYQIAQAGLDCMLDAIITTDKNIYPNGYDRFYFRDGKRLLVIAGEELFNPLSGQDARYLSLGAEKEQFNRNPGNLRDEIKIMQQNYRGNISFRHIELVNAEDLLTEGIYQGQKKIRENIQYFDDLLLTDQRFSGLAGTCTPNHTERFTYPELFSTAMNHILSEEPMNGDFVHDKLLILKHIKSGRLYFALDGLADARGFRFSAEGDNFSSTALPGDIIYLKNSITLKIKTPDNCTCRLIRNGKMIREWRQCKQVPFTIYEPGTYRVECSLFLRGNEYDWIFSNPIFVVRG